MADTDTTPGSVLPTLRAVTSNRTPFCHRGFRLRPYQAETGYSVAIEHLGLTLHTESGHRSAFSAERAARQFVDDALCVFEDADLAH